MVNEIQGPGPLTPADFSPVDATSDTAPTGAAVFDDGLVSKYSAHAAARWAAIHGVNGQGTQDYTPDMRTLETSARQMTRRMCWHTPHLSRPTGERWISLRAENAPGGFPPRSASM